MDPLRWITPQVQSAFKAPNALEANLGKQLQRWKLLATFMLNTIPEDSTSWMEQISGRSGSESGTLYQRICKEISNTTKLFKKLLVMSSLTYSRNSTDPTAPGPNRTASSPAAPMRQFDNVRNWISGGTCNMISSNQIKHARRRDLWDLLFFKHRST